LLHDVLRIFKNSVLTSLFCIFEILIFLFYFMNIPKTKVPRIVVIGGGFAGVKLAKSLKNEKVQVVLIDKHNYHTFQPLLYQVSSAGLELDSIAYPLRKIIKKHQNTFFVWLKFKTLSPS